MGVTERALYWYRKCLLYDKDLSTERSWSESIFQEFSRSAWTEVLKNSFSYEPIERGYEFTDNWLYGWRLNLKAYRLQGQYHRIRTTQQAISTRCFTDRSQYKISCTKVANITHKKFHRTRLIGLTNSHVCERKDLTSRAKFSGHDLP